MTLAVPGDGGLLEPIAVEHSTERAVTTRLPGLSIAIVTSIGAVIGATITMYSSVANRVTEIGTLRALGFGRTAILAT